MRRVLPCLPATLVAAVLVVFPPILRAATNDAYDLCSLIPSSAQATPLPDLTSAGTDPTYNGAPGCSTVYKQGGGFSVRVLAAPQSARQAIAALQNDTSDPNAGVRSASDFGDIGAEQLPHTAGTTEYRYGLTFARGCYLVRFDGGTDWTTGDARPAGVFRNLAAQVDTKLKGRPPCPTGGAAIVPNAGPLAAGLACDTGGLQGSREAVCTASVSGQRPNATIIYRWTLDGQVQGATSSALPLTNLGPGPHTVTVAAIDTANHASSDPQSQSFSYEAASAGGTSGGSPALGAGPTVSAPQLGPGDSGSSGGARLPGVHGRPNVVAPLVGGSAVAVAAALGLLALINVFRRRGMPLDQAVAAATATIQHRQTTSSPAATVSGTRVAGAPPATLPEVVTGTPPTTLPEDVTVSPWVPDTTPEGLMLVPDRRPRKRKTKPRLYVEFIVSPSMRTAGTASADAIQIWGDTPPEAPPSDGGDFLFAGYRLTVTPADWSIVRRDDGQPDVTAQTFVADRARIFKVEEFVWWSRDADLETPTDERKVLIQALWSEADRWMHLSVDVTVNVTNAEGETQPISGHAEFAAPGIHVIGAKPRLELSASADSANADGTTWITVTPLLYLFDTVYAGGWKIGGLGRRVTIGSATLDLNTYFEVPQDYSINARGSDPRLQPSLDLRCRFHLDDAALRAAGRSGVPLSFKVVPTGVGLGDAETNYDFIVANHYRNCARKYPNGFPQDAPATVSVRLLPSAIRCGDPDPSVLPHGTGDDRLTSILTASVVSASGAPVAGSVVKDDLKACVDSRFPEDYWAVRSTWGFTLSYKPPVEDWRRRIDHGLPEDLGPYENLDVSEGGLLHASDIDESGRINFGDPLAPAVKYDHRRHFYKLIDGSTTTRYLFTQTCALEVEFRVGDRDQDGIRRWITYPAGVIQIGTVELAKSYVVTVIVKAQSNELIAGAAISLGPTASPGLYTAQTGSDGRAVFSDVKVDDGDTFTIAASKRARLWGGTEGRKATVATKDPITLAADGQVITLELPCCTQWHASSWIGKNWTIPANRLPGRDMKFVLGIFGGGLLVASVTNRVTNRTEHLALLGGGFAPCAKLSEFVDKLSAGGWGQAFVGQLAEIQKALPAWYPSSGISTPWPDTPLGDFETPVPVMFEDFNGFGAMFGLSAEAGIGVSPSFVCFAWVYDWPIWVGSITLGGVGISGTAFVGEWFGAATPGITPPE